jgi:hypothetical protein
MPGITVYMLGQKAFWSSTCGLVFGCWELGVESRDLCYAEKERTACKD